MTASSPASGPSPALVAAGAVAGSRGGRTGVVSFGDVAAEAVALREGAAVVPLVGFAVHAVTGADAGAFLHRMLSQDLKGLALGAGRPSTFLDVRGRVQGDPVVFAVAGALLLVEEPAAAARTVPGLSRYVIADDVTFTDAGSAWDVVVLAGARAVPVGAAALPGLLAAGAAAAPLGWRPGGGVPRGGTRRGARVRGARRGGRGAGGRNRARRRARRGPRPVVRRGARRPRAAERGGARCGDLVEQGLLPRTGARGDGAPPRPPPDDPRARHVGRRGPSRSGRRALRGRAPGRARHDCGARRRGRPGGAGLAYLRTDLARVGVVVTLEDGRVVEVAAVAA